MTVGHEVHVRRPGPRLPQIALAVLLAVAALGSWPAHPVDAAGPAPGPTFNDPTSISDASRFAILNKLVRAIDGTPRGATIRMAFFSLTYDPVADRLIAAKRRGVHVQLIMDDHERWPAWDRVVRALGKDITKSSFAQLCHGACLTENFPSYQHTKVYMFSRTGGKSNVVMVSSANPTYFQARHGWNNLYTMVGDTILYEAFKKNFEIMRDGSAIVAQPTTSPDVYFTAESGQHKVYFFPKGGLGAKNDTMYQILLNIGCNGTASGYGNGGKTVIKVAMYQWAKLRVRLAERLWQLDDQGCKVEIMYDPTRADREILDALRKSGGRNKGPTLIIASRDKDSNGVSDTLPHDKFVLIDGIYAGDRSSRMTFTGSANWTNNSLHYNDEFMLRIAGSTTHAAFLKHYNKVKAWAMATATKPTGLTDGTSRPTTTGSGPTVTDGPTSPNEFLDFGE
jgi:hypothetical protein